MDKLKTLKDFDVHSDYRLLIKSIKAEAGKWLEELKFDSSDAILHHAKYGRFYDKMFGIDGEIEDRTQGLRHWIKYYFNITEEDLK